MTQKSCDDLPSRRSLHLKRPGRVCFGAGIHPRPRDFPSPPARQLGHSIVLDLPSDWTIRNQGERGACVAHAAVACLEYFLWRDAAPLKPLSEQFLHYKMRALQTKQHIVSDRTWLSEAHCVLRTEGICLQSECLYDPYLWPDGIDGAQPSDQANASAATRRFDTKVIEVAKVPELSPADHVYACLSEGQAVAISIALRPILLSPGFTNWTTRLGRYHGLVANPDGDCTEGHAVCIVGYLRNSHSHGGGRFICRNSWGLEWASEADANGSLALPELPGRGYGLLSAEYLNSWCSEIFTVSGPLR